MFCVSVCFVQKLQLCQLPMHTFAHTTFAASFNSKWFAHFAKYHLPFDFLWIISIINSTLNDHYWEKIVNGYFRKRDRQRNRIKLFVHVIFPSKLFSSDSNRFRVLELHVITPNIRKYTNETSGTKRWRKQNKSLSCSSKVCLCKSMTLWINSNGNENKQHLRKAKQKTAKFTFSIYFRSSWSMIRA